jgi:hypothetical protein
VRAKAPKLAHEDKPWFLSVNLVNPHDVMFFNTDAPGTDPVQDKRHLMDINRAPAHSTYQKSWNMPLPGSRKENWNSPGRPRAHYEYQDAELMSKVYEAQVNGQNPKDLGLSVNLTNRGAIRSITDGRYRYSRYFSPLQHNLPKTMEQIFEYNDVELYDLQVDPNEMQNLAVDAKANGDLLLAMNQKMIDIIDQEVGDDDGSFLPKNKKGWAITRFDP